MQIVNTQWNANIQECYDIRKKNQILKMFDMSNNS